MNAMNSNGHDGDLNDAINNHDMEVDNPAESNGFDKMDTDGPSSAQSEYNNLLKEIIKYGRDLKVEYGHNPRREVQRTLEETFGLVAWEDPMSAPEVAYLMRPQRRVEVGEELNSAILGKSTRAESEPPSYVQSLTFWQCRKANPRQRPSSGSSSRRPCSWKTSVRTADPDAM